MSLTTNLMDFVQRFQEIQQQKDSSDALIRDVLMYCDKLETAFRYQNQKITDELQDCKRENRDLQARLSTSEARTEWYTKEIGEIRNQNGYILVTIDGNGLLFRDQWIKQGVEGGIKAALTLLDAIKVRCGEHADDVEIITKVVANFGGLAKSLGRDLSDVKDFALGFTQAKAGFDFVDVGYGKDCVSSKIKDTVKWHIKNYNCRHILMGISHDAQYASFLDDLGQEDFDRQRLTIIEGAPIVPDLAATNICTMELGNDLFRNDKHIDKNSSTWPIGPWVAGPRTASPAASIGSASTPSRSSLSYANAANTASTAQNSPPPPQMILPIPPKPIARPAKVQYQQIPPQQPDWDPGYRGLDEPITVSISAMESIKKRKESDKLCNNHFLRGPCAKGDTCFFVHDYKPSSEEINAIAVLARQNPCTNGQDCELDECIYGHHCPSIRDNICTHPFCKFPEDAHPPGTKYKNPNIKSN
ncbi:hypothetical protein QQS21_012201 [Conoideocrella luteorostrata]|uniref:C3H1-type domain-containing protein n=1 Tax=Conoideocrella luteorostrata TaxID=1105319 RepID=A0AAJ0CG59_9HYPO|nr:hypothetical protein QQS21_012201 [Conoideocrella luteorostrata]